MKQLMVIVHDPSGAVVAACTADDPRTLDELVDKSVPIVTNDFTREIELDKADLRAYAVTGETARVLESPLNYFVTVTPSGGTAAPKVDLLKAQDTVKLSVTGTIASITVSSSGVEQRRAWLFVKSGATGDITPEQKEIAPTTSTLTFSTTVGSNDAAVVIVEKHRPDTFPA